jgi:cytoskeleton protein RodZ
MRSASASAASVPLAQEASAAAAKVAATKAAAAKAAAAKAKALAAAKAASPGSGASQPAGGAAGSAKVAITVSEPAWVSVVDANGNKLVFSTVEPGAPREVSGVPPFQVRVGNAAKVNLSFDGQPVDMSNFIHGTTATLELK